MVIAAEGLVVEAMAVEEASAEGAAGLAAAVLRGDGDTNLKNNLATENTEFTEENPLTIANIAFSYQVSWGNMWNLLFSVA